MKCQQSVSPDTPVFQSLPQSTRRSPGDRRRVPVRALPAQYPPHPMKKNHSMRLSRTGISCLLVALLGSVALSACGGDDNSSSPTTSTPSALSTLDGNPPLVIGHRGLPGLYPEETQVSYEGAADAGADSLEEDLHLSKDCVLVVRHNP